MLKPAAEGALFGLFLFLVIFASCQIGSGYDPYRLEALALRIQANAEVLERMEAEIREYDALLRESLLRERARASVR